MCRSHLCFALLAALMMWPSRGSATPIVPTVPVVVEMAFATEPVSSSELAATSGGASQFLGVRNHRFLAEPNMIGYLQQVGRTAGVAMDNWWGQTGAALIANNLLALH